MDLETVKEIESNIDFLYKPRIHLFGGEPTVHEDIDEIIDFFDSKGYRLSMTTNGTNHGWIGEDEVDKLDEVNISVNLEEYEYVKEAVEKINSYENPPSINVNCPLSPANHGRLTEIAWDFKGLDIASLVFQHLIWSRDESFNEEVDVETVKNQMEKVREMDIPATFFPPVKKEDIQDYYRNPDFPGTKCLAPWLRMEILPSGEVASCKWLVPDQDVVVGDAVSEELSSIWNGSRFREIRGRIRDEGVYEDSYCHRCCFRRYR